MNEMSKEKETQEEKETLEEKEAQEEKKTLEEKEAQEEKETDILEYSRPEVEGLELDESVTPGRPIVARSGMGNCKHTYI